MRARFPRGPTLVVLALLLTYFASAQSDRWEYLEESAKGKKWYFDLKSIARPDRNTVRVWVKTVDQKGNTEKTFYVIYRDRTFIERPTSGGSFGPNPIVPDSMVEALYDRLFRPPGAPGP